MYQQATASDEAMLGGKAGWISLVAPNIVPICIRQIEHLGSGFRQLGQHDNCTKKSVN